ncbi:hypothetical protein SOPP22_15195 [Shewanella sp. OPT22]|nr:hypothetical protein SOPP22_15195 [Shewanella sp. OPT22]
MGLTSSFEQTRPASIAAGSTVVGSSVNGATTKGSSGTSVTLSCCDYSVQKEPVDLLSDEFWDEVDKKISKPKPKTEKVIERFDVQGTASAEEVTLASPERVDLLEGYSDEELMLAADLAHFSYRTSSLDPSQTFKEIEINHQGMTNTGIDLSGIPKSDPRSGFCYRLFYDSNLDRYYLAFRGTDNKSGFFESIKQAMGVSSPAYNKAMKLSQILTDKVGKGRVVCVGHSLGGGLALASSKACGCKSIAFNPANVADKTASKFVRENGIGTDIHDIDNLAIVFTVKGELLARVNGFLPSGNEGGQRHIIDDKASKQELLGFKKHGIGYVRRVLSDYLVNIRQQRSTNSK